MKVSPLALGLFSISTFASAEPAISQEEALIPQDPITFCDRYEGALDMATLYEGDGPFLQELRLIGRYQGQYYNVESEGDHSDWENRRFRFGFAAQLLQNVEFQTEFNLKRDFDESGRFFEDVDTMFFTWEPRERIGVRVGKLKPAYTREYSTSSKRIKTIERSLIVDEVAPEKAGGAVFTFRDVLWGLTIDFGGFSGQLTEDWRLPERGSWGQFGRISRDFGENTNVRIDWFHRHGNRNQNAFAPYHENFSLNSLSDWGRLHLLTDLIYADDAFNELASDLNGAVIMPYYDLTDNLEAVLRYTYVLADKRDGIPVRKRYEREASPLARGDEYHAIYGGLNWYICGDKLKIMNGVEWSTIDGFDRDHKFWTFMTALRMYF